MLTPDLKSQIDRVWEAFWTGGLSNPLTVIEQMTYLLFIRSIIGLDANAAKLAFSELLLAGNFNSQQIRFIDTIINYFTAKGVVEPSRLFEAPFTDINANGMLGIFDEKMSGRIIALMEGVNRNA